MYPDQRCIPILIITLLHYFFLFAASLQSKHGIGGLSITDYIFTDHYEYYLDYIHRCYVHRIALHGYSHDFIRQVRLTQHLVY